MAVETNVEVTGAWLYKYMSVKKLKSILKKLPKDADIVPNRVGNLSVYIIDGDELTAEGYINFASEKYEEYV